MKNVSYLVLGLFSCFPALVEASCHHSYNNKWFDTYKTDRSSSEEFAIIRDTLNAAGFIFRDQLSKYDPEQLERSNRIISLIMQKRNQKKSGEINYPIDEVFSDNNKLTTFIVSSSLNFEFYVKQSVHSKDPQGNAARTQERLTSLFSAYKSSNPQDTYETFIQYLHYLDTRSVFCQDKQELPSFAGLRELVSDSSFKEKVIQLGYGLFLEKIKEHREKCNSSSQSQEGAISSSSHFNLIRDLGDKEKSQDACDSLKTRTAEEARNNPGYSMLRLSDLSVGTFVSIVSNDIFFPSGSFGYQVTDISAEEKGVKRSVTVRGVIPSTRGQVHFYYFDKDGKAAPHADYQTEWLAP